jgi:hypothetical protein
MNTAWTAVRGDKENKPPSKRPNVKLDADQPSTSIALDVEARVGAIVPLSQDLVMRTTLSSASGAFKGESYGDSFSPAFQKSSQDHASKRVSGNPCAGTEPRNEVLPGSEQKSSTASLQKPGTGGTTSIVRRVESASGTGCEAIVGTANRVNVGRRDIWTTRWVPAKGPIRTA